MTQTFFLVPTLYYCTLHYFLIYKVKAVIITIIIMTSAYTQYEAKIDNKCKCLRIGPYYISTQNGFLFL